MAGSDGDIGAGTDAGADADVPPGLKLGFWRIVLLLNFGPIAITVGVMLVVFGGYVVAGGVAVVAGVVALG
ncbi:MAG: hypothetical protein SXQ77_03830, partial [Halobacteria archaeon]|nr:hypothetical protein [Halobacteria archaeon]